MVRKAKSVKPKEPVVVDPVNMSFSWTKIQDYEMCPFMFKCKHIDKRITEVNPLMIVGRVTHHAINLYNTHCLKNKIEHDFDKWKECAYLALESESLDAEHYPEVLEMVKNYAESHMVVLECAIGSEEHIAVTRDFKECEWTDPKAWFRVVIDYLQIAGDVARITDYKAGWLLTAPKMQLEIYAWIVKKIYPQVSMFEVELDFVRHEYQEDFHIEEEELADIEKKILSKINKIEKDSEYKPSVGIACTYCGCWRWCSAMKEEDIGFKMPTDEKSAVELALKVEKHSKMLSEAKKILKVYCDNKGEVIAGGKKYGFTVSNSYDFEDISALISRADEVGVDIFGCLSVNNKKLKPLLDNEGMKKIVEELGKKDVSVTFTSKKYKASDDLAPKEDEAEVDKNG